jgi:hypothetical protein
MKAVPTGVALLATLVIGAAPITAGKPDPGPRWEYRVLTKEQVLDLGKKDLAVGLNQLGGDGWELAAVDTVYIFKRARGGSQLEVIKARLSQAEAEVETRKERVAWSERMVRKGFLSTGQLQAEKSALQAAEIAVQKARRELEPFLLPEPKKAPEKDDKPGS